MNDDHAPAGEVASGITEDQAASEMLKRWGVEDKEPKPTPEAETTETLETTEAEEATTEETEQAEETQTEESGEVEIDVAGEKFKLPAALKETAEKVQAKAKEVEAGATRKFQEAAEVRKAAEARAEQVERMRGLAQAQADLLADHKFVVRRLAQYEQINVHEMAQTDPAQLTRINAEVQQLLIARQRIEQGLQQAASDYDAEMTKERQARVQSLHEYASKNIKGWGPEADRNLNEYLGGKGIERETMLRFLEQEPKLLTILEEAVYGQKVRTAAPHKTPPKSQTLKPGGAGVAKTSAQQTAETANRRFAQTKTVDDAAAAILARANARKR
jgi:hypothetical protein